MDIRQAYECKEIENSVKVGDAIKRAEAMISELAAAKPIAAKALRALVAEAANTGGERLVEIVKAALAISVKLGVRPDIVAGIYEKAWVL